MDEDRVNIGEAAQILGVSVDTLRRWDKKGLLKSERATEKGYRFYSKKELLFFWKDLFSLAERWVLSREGLEPEPGFYCPSNDVFQNRLVKLQNELSKLEHLKTPFPLIVALVGEIGNNSYDHNLGNWRDIPGIFFAYNLEKRIIVLADRGQGVLKTLGRVKPELKTDKEAIEIAFTKIISGRAPEARGNGLKFVRKLVLENPLHLSFISGNAQILIEQAQKNLSILETNQNIQGCIALIKF